MKLFTSFLLALGLAANVSANQVVTVPEDLVLKCETKDGKHIQVSRNPVTDVFTILYGEDLRKPEYSVAAAGNNIGKSFRYSAEEGTDNREIYIVAGRSMTTVGVNDQRGVITGYLYEQVEMVRTLNAECKPEKLVSHFDRDEYFINLTEVD